MQQQKQDSEEVRRLIENSPYAIKRHGLREQLLARAAQMQTNRESVSQ